MESIVYEIPVESVDSFWGKVSGFLLSGLREGDAEFTIEELENSVKQGDATLYVWADEGNIPKGAAAVSFSKFNNACVAFVLSIGGRFIVNQDDACQFKSLLKTKGADRIHGVVSDSLVRLYKRFGFNKIANFVEAKL